MGYKKQRLGDKVVNAARSGDRYTDIHAFIGGTGAVGGTALLQMLSLYEEMMSVRAPSPEEVPILLATGTGSADIQAFTRRLFRFVQSRYGTSKLPRKVGSGYVTHSGVFVALERFQLRVLPGLEKIQEIPVGERVQFISNFLASLGCSTQSAQDIFQTLMDAVERSQPISDFLRRYQEKHYNDNNSKRFRSVILGIPIPSLMAYHLGHLEQAAKYIESFTQAHLDQVRKAFREAFRNDIQEVGRNLAQTVLVAHTTAVGGMYDEEFQQGKPLRRIRLGFAHSAQDDQLVVKQREAEEFTQEYSGIGIKIFITAAAIGIDEVRIRSEIPVHYQIAQKLKNAPPTLLRGTIKNGRGSKEDKRIAPSKLYAKIYKPLTFCFHNPPTGPATFEEMGPLRPSYSIRSGENGFFTVANADALYRVMRVASPSELGEVLATVGLFGDDPFSPWFIDNVCYYTETDNSRQVFDLLNQPPLLQTQLSGLEPMALQDLGSSKHQGELHTLSMLILLHRIRTLDIDAIDPYADLDHFDAARFFLEHSRSLTFEDLFTWQAAEVAHDIQILAAAETAQDLNPLNPGRPGLFPLKDAALHRVYERVLRAVWAIPSLGSPFLFERNGQTLVRTGYFVAPLSLLLTEQNSMAAWFQKNYCEGENSCSFEEYCNYHICNGGFVDLRPVAVLSTAPHAKTNLSGKIQIFRDEQTLQSALGKIEPYTFFTTCGLVATLYRLRSLYNLLREAMTELGTLHEFRWQMPRDVHGHILLVPGAVEALRMISEGLEKTTGTERLDGIWQYERRWPPERWNAIPGLKSTSLSN